MGAVSPLPGRADLAISTARHSGLTSGARAFIEPRRAAARRQPRRAAGRRTFRPDRRNRAAGVVRPRRSSRQGAAAARHCRCRQCDRWRRRARAYGRHGGRGAHARRRHRADPPALLPRPQPHRVAGRVDGRGGARRAQSPAAARRRSDRRRSARRPARLRPRFTARSRRRRERSATTAGCPTAPGRRHGTLLHRGCRHADRSACRLAARCPQGQDRRRRPVRADPDSAWTPPSCAAMRRA